jgi:hypothetical protein
VGTSHRPEFRIDGHRSNVSIGYDIGKSRRKRRGSEKFVDALDLEVKQL